MATTPDVLAHKTLTSRLASSTTGPQASAPSSSPRTPLNRAISSLYGSPSSFRSDEEIVVLEFGSRKFRAGLAGENAPRCVLSYGPNEQRRAGDYSQWLLDDEGGERNTNKSGNMENWGKDHELWPLDLRNADLELIQDKINRVLRDARIRFLLSDSKSKRALLILPSVIPHALLAKLLASTFTICIPASITLTSTPLMCTFAAGQRSAVVVDVGWAETTVSVVYEYREVRQIRSQRAGKLLVQAMGSMLRSHLKDQSNLSGIQNTNDQCSQISFEDSEEVLTKYGWCLKAEEAHKDGLRRESEDLVKSDNYEETTIDLHLKDAKITLQVPFRKMSAPAEKTLFASGSSIKDFDDNENPLHLLIYHALLAVSMDIRRICVSRIIFTGGVSNLPGLKRRTIQELKTLIQDRGWDPIKSYGTAQVARNQGRFRSTRLAADRSLPVAVRDSTQKEDSASTDTGVHESDYRREPAIDKIDKRIQDYKSRDEKTSPHGVVRAICGLGPWAGGSLMAGLRIRGVVEIDRESFLQHGLAGAGMDKQSTSGQQRQTLSRTTKPNMEDRSGWTLGPWA